MPKECIPSRRRISAYQIEPSSQSCSDAAGPGRRIMLAGLVENPVCPAKRPGGLGSAAGPQEQDRRDETVPRRLTFGAWGLGSNAVW